MLVVCHEMSENRVKQRFRRHMVMHKPEADPAFLEEKGIKGGGVGKHQGLSTNTKGDGRKWKNSVRELWKTCVKVLGVEHPDTLTSMGNLALLYKDQGRWKEAEELKVHVVEALLRVLGALRRGFKKTRQLIDTSTTFAGARDSADLEFSARNSAI